jgi:hypothetical protein
VFEINERGPNLMAEENQNLQENKIQICRQPVNKTSHPFPLKATRQNGV